MKEDIKEGDSFSASLGSLFQAVIVERNDDKRLSYWIYDSVVEKFIFHDIAKPSSLAKNHLTLLKSIKKREKNQCTKLIKK